MYGLFSTYSGWRLWLVLVKSNEHLGFIKGRGISWLVAGLLALNKDSYFGDRRLAYNSICPLPKVIFS